MTVVRTTKIASPPLSGTWMLLYQSPRRSTHARWVPGGVPSSSQARIRRHGAPAARCRKIWTSSQVLPRSRLPSYRSSMMAGVALPVDASEVYVALECVRILGLA